jgi:hypothetical protein
MKKTTTKRFAGNEGAADLRKGRIPGIMKWITRASLIPLIVAFAAQNGWASSHTSHNRSYHRKSSTHCSHTIARRILPDRIHQAFTEIPTDESNEVHLQGTNSCEGLDTHTAGPVMSWIT